MPRPQTKRILYSIQEVMAMTGRGRSTIYRWIRNGTLKTVKARRGDQMITAASIEKLIEGEIPQG